MGSAARIHKKVEKESTNQQNEEFWDRCALHWPAQKEKCISYGAQWFPCNISKRKWKIYYLPMSIHIYVHTYLYNSHLC